MTLLDKAGYTSKSFRSRFTEEKTYWKNHFWTRCNTCSLRKNNLFVAVWTSSIVDGLGEKDPFHELHGRLIYRFWTFSYEGYIETNVHKTRLKDLNDFKSRITQVQSIEKRTLHDVFLEIRKRLDFNISLKGNTFEQYV